MNGGPVKVEILKDFEDLFFVKIGDLCHIVQYDARTKVLKSVYSADKIDGEHKESIGFTAEAIQSITKGRKQSTTNTYYKEIRRRIQLGY